MTPPKSGKAEQPIPLVRAAFAEGFRIAMNSNGIDADTWFKKVRLPLAKLSDPESLLPLKPFWHLINSVAISENIHDFGAQVARAIPWFQIETMHPTLSQQPDLRALLSSFCQLASDQSSYVIYGLKIENGICRFDYQANPMIANDIQMEIYRVTSMIELVQVAAGAGWRPLAIDFLMPENKVVQALPIFAHCLLKFSRGYTAISFDEELLGHATRGHVHGRQGSSDNREPGIRLANHTDIIAALSEILENYITEETLSIELVADIAGMSTRQLQRLIQAQGSSYRDLLNRARRQYAEKRLRDSRTGIGDIARQLGYSDPAHFTRAFRRWTGLTPSAYRRNTG